MCLFSSLRILKQYEHGVTFLLGKFWASKGPGLVFVPAAVAKMRRRPNASGAPRSLPPMESTRRPANYRRQQASSALNPPR